MDKILTSLEHSIGKSYRKFAKPKGWDEVSISWTNEDTTDFSHELPFPQLDVHKDNESTCLEGDAKKKLIVAHDPGLEKPSEFQGTREVTSGIMCNSVSQWLTVKIRTPWDILEADRSTWPKASVWAFLQPPTIHKRGKWKYIIDDFPRIGFFNGVIDPTSTQGQSNKAIITRKTPFQNKGDKSKFTWEEKKETEQHPFYFQIDDTKKIITYQIQVIVRNDWTADYQGYLVDHAMKESDGQANDHRKRTLDQWNNASYMKIWARNYEIEWGKSGEIDQLNDELLDTMNERDPYLNTYSKVLSPQNYRNHTWRRERITDKKGEKLIIIALYPAETIDLLNGKTFDEKKVDFSIGTWIFLSVGFIAGSYAMGKAAEKRAKDKGYADDSEETAQIHTNFGNLLTKTGIIDILAAYAVTGFGADASTDKEAEKSIAIKTPSEAVKKAKEYDKQNTDHGKLDLYNKTKAIYEFMATLLVQKSKANYSQFKKDKDKEHQQKQNDGYSHSSSTVFDGDTRLSDTDYKATFSGDKFNVEATVAEGSATKSIPACGFRLPVPWLAWLVFSIDFEASGSVAATLDFESVSSKKQKKVGVGLKGHGKLGGKLIGQAWWTKMAKSGFSTPGDDDDLNHVAKGDFDVLEPLMALAKFGTVEASLGLETGLLAALKVWFTWYEDPKDEDRSNWSIDPTLDWSLGAPLHLQLSCFTYKHDFLEGSKIMSLKRYEGYLFDSLAFSVPIWGKLGETKKTLRKWGEIDFEEFLEQFTKSKPNKVILGETFSFSLSNKKGLRPLGTPDAIIEVPGSPVSKGTLSTTYNSTPGSTPVLSDMKTSYIDGDKVKNVLNVETRIDYIIPKKKNNIKTVKTIDSNAPQDTLNLINMLDPNDTGANTLIANWVSGKGIELQPAITPDGGVKRSLGKHITLTIPVPQINVDSTKFIDGKARYYLNIENFKSQFIFVHFLDLDTTDIISSGKKDIIKKACGWAVEIGNLIPYANELAKGVKELALSANETVGGVFDSTDDEITVKGKKWSAIQINYTNLDFTKGYIEIVINKDDFTVRDQENEEEITMYPLLALDGKGTIVVCDKNTSKSLRINSDLFTVTV